MLVCLMTFLACSVGSVPASLARHALIHVGVPAQRVHSVAEGACGCWLGGKNHLSSISVGCRRRGGSILGRGVPGRGGSGSAGTSISRGEDLWRSSSTCLCTGVYFLDLFGYLPLELLELAADVLLVVH